MPTGTPSLDNFTKNNLDTLTVSLDSASFLTSVDWSNPTLEQLDAWGTMDALDGFGTLEQLADLDVIHCSGSAPIAFTATAAIQFAIDVAGTANIAVTAASDADRIRTMSASITGAFGFTATITPLRQMSGTAKVLGEDWIDNSIGTETWSDIAVGSEVWATVATGSEVWARQ